MRWYPEELAVAAYLSGLTSELSSQVPGQVLGSDSTPNLESTFTRVLRIFTDIPTSTSDHSIMTATCGCSHSFGRGGGQGWTDGRVRTPCEHCGHTNHRSDRCWEKFGKSHWTQISTEVQGTSSTTFTVSASPVTLSQEEYAQFLQFRETQSSAAMASHATASTSSTSGLFASRDSSWIIDSETSSHMTGSCDLYSRLFQLPSIRSVFIADGRTCRVSGQSTIRATSQLTLDKVLYVPEFPVNLLSISSITKHLNCFVTFFPFHCTFQDLQTGKRIGLGHDKGQGVYLLIKDEIPRGLASLTSTADQSII